MVHHGVTMSSNQVKKALPSVPGLYCPVCQRFVLAANIEEVRQGKHTGYIFVHDKKPHSDSDMAALSRGIQ